MSVSDPGLRRVSVHAGAAVLDTVLPAQVPVASMLPALIDLLKEHGVEYSTTGPCHLSTPGNAALNTWATLAQCGIRDGAVLVLSAVVPPPPRLRYDDTAQAVVDTLHPRMSDECHRGRRPIRVFTATTAGFLTGVGCLTIIRPSLVSKGFHDQSVTAGAAVLAASVVTVSAMFIWRAYRDAMAGLTLSLIAVAFAAVAGFLAVPGPAGLPNVLLAATAAAAAVVLMSRVNDCASSTMIAVGGFSVITAVAAFAGMMTTAPLYAVGAACALLSLSLLGVAGRAAIALSGLAAELETGPGDLPARAVRADAWSTALQAAFSSSAATGALVTVLANPARLVCLTYAAATGVLLLFRVDFGGGRRALACGTAAVVTIGTTFAVAATGAPGPRTWIVAATVVLAGTTLWLGLVAPGVSLSPVPRKAIELFERSLSIAMAPLACWICGLYETARGLYLTWS